MKSWRVYTLSLAVIVSMIVWGYTLKLGPVILTLGITGILVWLDGRQPPPRNGLWYFIRSILIGAFSVGLWKFATRAAPM